MKISVPLRDGAKLHVRVHGRGRPVVLLHGYGSQGAHWLANVLPLTHRYRFILPDQRGFGASHDVAFRDADVFATMARDVEDVLDHLGIDRVILGGVSMGAYVGLKLNTLGKFDRMTKYLHIDQSPQVRNDASWRHGLFGEDQARIFDRFRRLLSSVDEAGAHLDYWRLPTALRAELREIAALFFCYAFEGRRQQAFVRRVMRLERLSTRAIMPVRRWSTYLEIMRSYMDQDHDARPALEAIRIPVTLMVGMRSRMYPPAGQLSMGDAIRHARVVRFERSGHVPMLDEPLRFQRAFAEFLAR